MPKMCNWLFVVLIFFGPFIFNSYDQALAAEDYPSRAITVINPFRPGGGTDIEVRNLMPYAQKYMGQPVVVKSMPGAAGTIGMTATEDAKQDGYTIVAVVLPDVVLGQELQDAGTHAQNFKPIYGWFEGPMAIEVKADSPYQSLEELVAAAKVKKLKAALVGIGSIDHLLTLLFEKHAGIETIKIPYGGGGPATKAGLSGEVDFLIGVSTTGLRFVRDGKLRMLAILGPERIKEVPDVPTIYELGYKDFPYIPFVRGVMAPPGVSDEIVTFLEESFKKAVDDQGFKDVMTKQGRPVKPYSSKDMKKVVESNFELAKEYLPFMKAAKK
ncbi:MAG: tripartite tricarboxylate transporter substrate binding protein [Desulfobacterales bacterium]|nr:tripartite tricarboxylate transporter substrate binding protein [Desulfobacterales bacterium]